jgi:hypothetical protein
MRRSSSIVSGDQEGIMAATVSTATWHVRGDYFETCNCDYLCPCIYTNMAGKPTKGRCDFALVFHVGEGEYQGTRLDDLSFAVIGYTPGAMGEGNGAVGLIIDERADQAQQDALVAIASGQAGGPMANLAPALPTFLGAERKPIHFTKEGTTRSVSIPGVLDEAAAGVESPVVPGELLYVDNTVHPANARLGLAKAIRSHVSVFGLKWDDDSGTNNGHIAPFDWRGA